MNRTIVPHADWPSRFVYVCTASRGAILNHAPMHHAGAERLSGLVILRALSSPNQPTPADISESISPADRLRTAATQVFGLPKGRIRMITGHADLLAPWGEALHVAAELGRSDGSAIVLNTSSGRRQAVFGALFGKPQGPDAPEIVMITAGFDCTIRRVDLMPDGQLVEQPLPMRTGLPIESYLSLYGVRVLNASARARREDWLISHADAYDIISAGLLDRAFCKALCDVQARIARRDDQGLATYSLAPNEVAALSPVLDILSGAARHGATLDLTPDAQRFLSGLWLEGLALTLLRAALAQESSIHLACGIEIAARRGPHFKSGTDLDLVVLHDDRLGLIECKAGRDVKLLRQGIVRLAHYRGALSAQAGSAWLLAPMADAARLEADGLQAQAAEAGVTVLTGASAIDQLRADMSARFGLQGA